MLNCLPFLNGWGWLAKSAIVLPIAFIAMRRILQSFFLLAILVAHGRMAVAQETATEQSVRAAMVLNFLQLIEFPPESLAKAQQLRLCVAVGDPWQAEALAALSGRKIGARELIVVRLAGRDDDCQVLYVDSRLRWNAADDRQGFSRVLTISAYPGFARDGGMIEIALQEGRPRFEINLVEGRRAGFHFSPNLLRLARRIHE